MASLQRSKSLSQTSQLQIQHFTHHHVLHKLYITSNFICNGCNTGGSYGVRYHCSACNFDLHEECATAPHRILTNLHPHHHLVLVNRPGYSHVCYVCKGVTNGLSYTCEISPACEFNVHVLCTQAPTPVEFGSVNNYHQQQHATAFGGYQAGMSSQPVMVNHQHHQHAMPTTSFNTNQPYTTYHSQQVQIPPTGYNVVNYNHTVMITHPPPPPQQQTDGYVKVLKLAANVLSTSLIGVPMFMSRR